MKQERVLAQAVGAWLQYEFACNRTNLFNERYLSTPISGALTALHQDNVHSEYLHPILAPYKTGPGRRPEVDFATIRSPHNLTSVVESKWVGAKGLPAGHVLWDLLRLELIAHHTGVPAYFVLAGRRRHLEKWFLSRAFRGALTSRGKYRYLLKLDRRSIGSIRVDTPNRDRQPIFKKLFADYPDVSFSSRITTSIPQKYPEECPMYQYQAYAWQVISPVAPRFVPRSNASYAPL